MVDGIYLIKFTGRNADYGTGSIILTGGKVFGVDAGGVEYTGSYNVQNNNASGQITLNVPAGTALVTGALPSLQPYQVSFPFSMPSNMNKQQTTMVLVQLPTGPVNANIKKVKALTHLAS